MNDIIKDYKEEGYTMLQWIVLGVVAPLVLIALAIICCE